VYTRAQAIRAVAEPIEHARRSSIWSRTGDGWVMRFHQGTLYVP